jgi:acyl-homoserine lactone acylase PvdQ
MREVSVASNSYHALDDLNDKTREVMQAYIDGINDYVQQSWLLPIEFWITNQKWQPWEIVHSIQFYKVLDFFLTRDFLYEPLRTELARKYG